MRILLLTMGLLGLLACGSADTGISANVALGVPPFVSTTTAAATTVGGTLTLTGFGFSFVAAENVLIISDTAVSATQYTLLSAPSGDQIEQLTFALPAALVAADYTAALHVVDQASNSFAVTVNP